MSVEDREGGTHVWGVRGSVDICLGEWGGVKGRMDGVDACPGEWGGDRGRENEWYTQAGWT